MLNKEKGKKNAALILRLRQKEIREEISSIRAMLAEGENFADYHDVAIRRLKNLMLEHRQIEREINNQSTQKKCSQCGREIVKERLEALLFTTDVCAKCARKNHRAVKEKIKVAFASSSDLDCVRI